MNTLNLQPVPADLPRGLPSNPLMDGFVDEAVVSRMVELRHSDSSYTHTPPRAIWPSDNDYAGWRAPAAIAPRQPVSRVTPPPSQARVNAPQPDTATADQGDHRWWLASLAGFITSLVLAAALLSFVFR